MGLISTGITVTLSGLVGAELLDVTASGEDADIVEMTHQASTDKYKEFAAGFVDGGEFTLTLNYESGVMPAAGGASTSLSITWPSGGGSVSATVLIRHSREVGGGLGQKLTGNVTVKVTGKPTWS